MLEIKNQDYFDKVKDFAERKGLLKMLEERLDYLRKFADHEQQGLCVVELYKDFAPASFEILWKKRDAEGNYKVWFNGGLIFHGSQEGWGNTHQEETFSVRIGDDPNPWSIHT